MLSNTSEVLSLMLRCNVHYSGGNLDWNGAGHQHSCPIWGGHTHPSELKSTEPSSLDSDARLHRPEDVLEGNPSYNHSEHFPMLFRRHRAEPSWHL